MRLIAWNCAGAFHRKIDALMALRPDVAVVSECAEPEVLAAKCELPAFSAAPIWTGKNPNKGLAVLFFNDVQARLHSRFHGDLPWIAPIEITAPRRINLLAVWAQNASAGNLRKANPGPLRRGVEFYRRFLTEDDAVIAGDFNNNIFWDKPGWAMNHQDTVDRLGDHGLVSAYHAATGEAQGEETVPTHYWRDRKKDGPTYHIDYIFMPERWVDGTYQMRVEAFEPWTGKGLSDHVPLVLDVAL